MTSSPALEALISPEYLTEQERLHAQPEGYGGKGRKWAENVRQLCEDQGANVAFDYGCGQASLMLELEAFGIHVHSFDPAVLEYATLRMDRTYPVVVCTDVLEHVEPEKLDAVLAILRDLLAPPGRLFLVVSIVETEKRLSDGRQAHILLRPTEWWRGQMTAAGFRILDEIAIKPEKQWVAVLERVQ
jgi:hypothetical protein